VEYQLLLPAHADAYLNPFSVVPTQTLKAEVVHRNALAFGPVCLRRESWCAPVTVLVRAIKGTDLVTRAIALRRWFYEHVTKEDLWFYRLTRCGERGRKPRFLDLASPLSTAAFWHVLQSATDYVVFNRMEPAPSTLWQVDGERYVAELMLEV
jgi:hypothetical protein